MSKTIKVGTRGSELALAQTDLAIQALKQANPDVRFEKQIVRTEGDRNQSPDITTVGYGVFVSELEAVLSDGEVDIAVHSLKDMPSTLPDEFQIAAVPYREDPRDVIVSSSGLGLMDLPRGAVVATGSARRKTLVLEKRPDISVVPIRGNVPTRLRKLGEDETLDAVVLAAAGLKRLGLEEHVTEYLKCWDFVAAVGQGALAVETRADDADAIRICKPIDDVGTRLAVEAERAFLAAMESGCSAPVSAHARVGTAKFRFIALAGTVDGTTVLRAEREGPEAASQDLALELADELLAQGAAELVHTDSKGAR